IFIHLVLSIQCRYLHCSALLCAVISRLSLPALCLLAAPAASTPLCSLFSPPLACLRLGPSALACAGREEPWNWIGMDGSSELDIAVDVVRLSGLGDSGKWAPRAWACSHLAGREEKWGRWAGLGSPSSIF
ncbi:hypothetical protein CMEL01_06327, partial [Colletotrichum melonis]